jgi:hypothetical protein
MSAVMSAAFMKPLYHGRSEKTVKMAEKTVKK